MDEEVYNPKQDVRDMLAGMFCLATEMHAIYWATRQRHLRFMGNAPTWNVFARLDTMMKRIDEVLLEQIGVLINR